MIYGEGRFRYELVEDWEKPLKRYFSSAAVPGINIDENDRLYVLFRESPPIMILDTDCNCLTSFGAGIFSRPHGIFLCGDGSSFVADDDAHAVYKFSAAHRLLFTMGTRGVPSDTGCIGKKTETIVRAAGPFNYPTNVAVAKNGDVYVSDGYGNARVHVFDPEGKLKFSWGEPGNKPGQFNLPHSLRFDAEERLYVCDRANNRIQIFDTEGHFLDQWTGFIRPADLFLAPDGVIYVAECKRSNNFDGSPSRVTIVDGKGDILARVGGTDDYDPARGHHTAHGIAVDRENSIYVAEVGQRYPGDYIGLKKYRRV